MRLIFTSSRSFVSSGMDKGKEMSCSVNVGGCSFSISLSRLPCFKDSILFREVIVSGQRSRWFLDRDGCTFRHVHYYMHTGKLASSCVSEVNILSELASSLHLTSLQKALENLQSGKHFLRARPVDLQVTKRATLNYWKTRICNTKQQDTLASPACTVHDAVPLGLVGTPLVDSDEEVPYCFLPLALVRQHPSLVSRGNLLWLCNDVAIVKCGSRLFRFLANFLQTGKITLPENFSDYDGLCDEAKMVGMTEFIQALQELWEDINSDCGPLPHTSSKPASQQPLYEMSFDLLVRYPDSALGQLLIDSNMDGSTLFITGAGVLFQHVENWLGTSHLPLTTSEDDLQGLCTYLDSQDEVYLAIREALRRYFHRKQSNGSFTTRPWSASVGTFTIYKVVKVYVGTHWYATYFKTLLKHPELLSNSWRVSWISYGESLYVKGDGQMFRHILNFLREWLLLRQEIEAFGIPALSAALKDCSDYRAWCEAKGRGSNQPSSSSVNPSLFIYHIDSSLDISGSKEEVELNEQQMYQRHSPENSAVSMEVETSTESLDEDAVHLSVDASHEGAKATDDASNAVQESLAQTHTQKGGGSLAQGITPTCQHSDISQKGGASLPRPQELPAAGLTERCSDLAPFAQNFGPRAPPGGHDGSDDGSRRPGQECWEVDVGLLSLLEGLALLVEGSQWAEVRRTLSALSVPERAAAVADLLKEVRFNMRGSQQPGPNQAVRPLEQTQDLMLDKPMASWSTGVLHQRRLPMTGCVLKVEHPPVLGKGEPGGYFTHSVIYLTQQPNLSQSTNKDPKDVAFAYFNMAHEEMTYACECHRFLTGIILDSKGLDSQDCSRKIANLVHFLWTGQVGAERFVKDLLRLLKATGERRVKERTRLVEWIQLTLPLAKRFAECMELLMKGPCLAQALFP